MLKDFHRLLILRLVNLSDALVYQNLNRLFGQKMFPNMNIFVTNDRPSKIILEIRKKYFGKNISVAQRLCLRKQNVELEA